MLNTTQTSFLINKKLNKNVLLIKLLNDVYYNLFQTKQKGN